MFTFNDSLPFCQELWHSFGRYATSMVTRNYDVCVKKKYRDLSVKSIWNSKALFIGLKSLRNDILHIMCAEKSKIINAED